MFVTVSGLKGGRLMQETYAHKIYAQDVGGVVRTAIQVTTAAGICATLDLLADGLLPHAGFIGRRRSASPASSTTASAPSMPTTAARRTPVWSAAPAAPAKPLIKAIA